MSLLFLEQSKRHICVKWLALIRSMHSVCSALCAETFQQIIFAEFCINKLFSKDFVSYRYLKLLLCAWVCRYVYTHTKLIYFVCLYCDTIKAKVWLSLRMWGNACGCIILYTYNIHFTCLSKLFYYHIILVRYSDWNLLKSV